MAVKDKKYQLGTAENKAFLDTARDNLLNFGTKFRSDGSSYWLGDDGTPWKDRNRATWITCRMTHVYCLGAFVGFPGAEELVDAGLKGLKGALHDDVNDGWYPEITPEGGYTPTKQCYAHAFVLLASSSATLLGRPGAAELLDHAEKVFLDKFWDDGTGLSVDTWNTEFTELDPYRGLNANMHSVEAFLAVADVTGDETWRKRAGVSSSTCSAGEGQQLAHPRTLPFRLVARPRMQPREAGRPVQAVRRDSGPRHRMGRPGSPSGPPAPIRPIPAAAAPYIDAAEHLFNRAVEDAWNADGAPGLVYTTDWDGKPVVHDRMHWTLAEGINTSSTLARMTGKESYAKWYATFLEYADSTVMDHVNGSWFHQLDRTNQPIGTVWRASPTCTTRRSP